jgi:uncharacterized protein (TIGR02453 family)
MASNYFTNATFTFLKDLEANNDREWFHANKHRYEDHLKDPAVRFIIDFGDHLKKISGHFRADPRPVGGSMFRIYRDTRFARDKTPYKTHVGIQFRHDLGKDAHAPGFYLHVEDGGCFAGAGMWHPDSPSLKGIREAMVEDPKAWKRAVGGKRFRDAYKLEGDRLKRPPRGFDPEHPLAEELKWKDFIGVAQVSKKMVTSPDLPKELAKVFGAATPLMKFLCEAVSVPF